MYDQLPFLSPSPYSPFGPARRPIGRPIRFVDGTSNTIGFGEHRGYGQFNGFGGTGSLTPHAF